MTRVMRSDQVSGGPRPAGSGPEGPARAHRARRRFAARIIGSAVILTLLLLLLPAEDLVAAFRRMPFVVLAGAVPVYLALHLLGAFKWRLLLNAGGAALSPVGAVRCYYAGLFGSTFLPSIVGGDFVRAGLAFRQTRSRTAVLVGSVLDRALDLLALAIVAGIGVLLVPRALDPGGRTVFLGLAATLGGLGLVGVVLLLALPARRFPFRIRRHLVRLRRVGRAFARQPAYALAALAMGIVLQTVLVLLNAWLGRAVGLEVGLHVWLFVWPLGKISAAVPLTQGGIGVREAALAALFAPFGVPAVLAVAAGLAFQAVVISGGLAGGAISYLLGRLAAGRLAAGTPRASSAELGNGGVA
jgi:hypothetical protein